MKTPLQTAGMHGAKDRKPLVDVSPRWQVSVSVHRACERQDWKAVGTGSGDLSNRIRKQQVSFEMVQVENQVQET